MNLQVYFVTALDGDPDPVDSPFGANDTIVLRKYHVALDIVKEMCGGKGAICVHTSPQYRRRFLSSPFTEYWLQWMEEGGELILHPEEDLYSTPDTRLEKGTYYRDPKHMERVILETVDFMRNQGFGFTAFRGAYFGLTNNIVAHVKKAGIAIDLSCAPGIVMPGKAADWTNAPTSGYYMSKKSYLKPCRQPKRNDIFEIPLGWDGLGINISHNYLFNERSTYKRMCIVWDAIVERSIKLKTPQFIHFLFHTYTMSNKKFRNKCESILGYMQEHNGIPVTASEAGELFDKQSSLKSDRF